jgi:hypothetical protein
VGSVLDRLQIGVLDQACSMSAMPIAWRSGNQTLTPSRTGPHRFDAVGNWSVDFARSELLRCSDPALSAKCGPIGGP